MLSNLIILLGLNESELDDAMKSKLNLIISGATARLKLLLGGAEPPEEMSHIILDALRKGVDLVVVKRGGEIEAECEAIRRVALLGRCLILLDVGGG